MTLSGATGRLAGAAVLSLVLGACVSEQVQSPTAEWGFTSDSPQVSMGPVPPPPDDEDLLGRITPATAADLDPDFLSDEPPSPFHRLGHNVIRGIDGSWSKIYTLRAGRGAAVVDLIRSYVEGFPAEPNTPSDPGASPTEVMRWVIHGNFHQDEAPVVFGEHQPLPNVNIADVLHVTAPPETLLFIDQLLDKALADLPQIELQVRVVEVNLDDTLDWDVKTVLRNLVDPTQPFDPIDNPVEGKFGSGEPILDGDVESGIGAGFTSFPSSSVSLSGFLLSIQGILNDVRIDSVLSLLQSIGSAELISSPSVTVLNGHRARLVTGDKVPVFSASGNVNNPNVTTDFVQTGVTMDMVPFIVGDGLVRIDLSVEVSTQTGAVPFNISGTEVSSPIISQRSAGTTVHVYSNQAFALGGLKASRQLETLTKVPLLGDLPILGWLFKSRTTQKQNTEILFFITPTIHIPSESLISPLRP